METVKITFLFIYEINVIYCEDVFVISRETVAYHNQATAFFEDNQNLYSSLEQPSDQEAI